MKISKEEVEKFAAELEEKIWNAIYEDMLTPHEGEVMSLEEALADTTTVLGRVWAEARDKTIQEAIDNGIVIKVTVKP